MAKWGEGDPRWIVEERADATNVNNWHWTEKNATGWSKERLKSLLIGLKIEGAAGIVELTEFSTLDGEASANNRKRKLIFFYEWDIKIKWKGTLNTEDMDSISGSISIPNLSDEQDMSDIEVSVSIDKDKPGSQAVKDMIRNQGADLIREKLSTYLVQLRQEFSQGMILPTNQNQTPPTSTDSGNASKIAEEFKSDSTNNSLPTNDKLIVTKNTPVKIDTRKISMRETFMCSKEELYRALTEKNMVQAFTRASITKWELETGGKFCLFDDMISGEFQQLVPSDCLVQRWRMKNWPDEHYSTVTIKLEQNSNCTTLTLSQTGVPTCEVERTKSGWLNYYWNSIRQTFGYAVNIF